MSVTEMPFRRMTEAEWQTRVDLAACYRLVDLFGWSDLINTRITARVPGRDDYFLINPYGLLFEEVTASSLVKIDAEGNKIEPSEWEVNSAGFAIPSAVHITRPELGCVLHTHSIAGCAVSMQKDGLLPLNQHALQVIGDVAYHDYEGTARNPEERARFLADLGDRHIMVLRNHGLLIVGTSIAAAFVATYRMERACAIQLTFQQSGAEFHPIGDEVVSAAYDRFRLTGSGRSDQANFEWPALLRKLDRIDPSEHIPLFLKVPGVITARRFRAHYGKPAYVALYHVENTGVYATPAWMAVNRTPWILRLRKFQRNRTYFMFQAPLYGGA